MQSPRLLFALAALLVVGACKRDAASSSGDEPVRSAPASSTSPAASAGKPTTGPWRATVMTKGGELPFSLELHEGEGAYTAVIVNGAERVPVDDVTLAGDELTLALPLYDSRIVAKVLDGGQRLEGTWSRASKNGRVTLPFAAKAGDLPRFPPDPSAQEGVKDVSGRWSVKRASREELAVGVFERDADGTVTGSLMTATGDFRYLTGVQQGRRLLLSTFDGCFAYLIRATLDEEGDILEGELFSGARGHDTFTARRDDGATLADGFLLSRWTGERALADLEFKDLDGEVVSLGDARFRGKARIIEVFGTWCPNCHDATRHLVELHRRYRDQGLEVIGLAFEYTGDFARDAAEVRKWKEHHGVEYPLLIAGTTGEGGPSDKLPIDNFRAYPTTLFVDRDDRVVAVHAGFSGPATGAAHEALTQELEERVRSLLQ